MARRAKTVSLPSLGALDRNKGDLSRQLANALRVAIRNGEIREGETLPSTRALANTLQVARGTVVDAFEQLLAEGFLESRRGSSTRVGRSTPQERVRSVEKVVEQSRPPALPEIAATYRQVARQYSPLPSVPFAISVPTDSTAPADAWRLIGNRVRARGPGAPAGYGDPQGAISLREAIAEYVRRSRSVRCDAGHIIITSGTQQGLYLAAQVLIGPKNTAWVENPAYPALTGILETMGRRFARVSVDGEGLDVAEGRRVAPDASVAFVTPSHQYPLGMPMSMRRRTALLDWASKRGAWVVEDDYDAEMRYVGHSFPSLQGLDRHRVVYLGTFSKVLFPSLRLGYAIVPEPLIDPFLGARILMDRHPPTADQYVLATFIGEGHLDRHIRRVRHVYAEQHAHLVDLLQRLLPPALGQVQPCDQGMHLVVWLREGTDDSAVAATAAANNIAVRPVSSMFAPGTQRPGLLLGFGGFSRDQIEWAARRLIEVIAHTAKRGLLSGRPKNKKAPVDLGAFS